MKSFNTLAILSAVLLIGSSFIAPKETYDVDASSSKIKWTGYHLAKSYEHWGNVSIKSGTVEMFGGKVSGGEIIIDMTSISNGDLDDAKENAKLVKHLKSNDFFGVKKYAESSLKIKSGESNGDKHTITADLTIRGITKEITFEATQTESEESLFFKASLDVDRTAHEVMYGWKLENAILSNTFKLDIDLVVNK